MMTILRQDTDYAMRALVYLAFPDANGFIPVSKIASAADIPLPYAHKIIRKLRDAGIVICHRGARGGVTLASHPRHIRLADVINAVQGKLALNRCLLDKNMCSRRKSCGISRKMVSLQNQMVGLLEKTTLADVVSETDDGRKKKRKGGR